MSAVDPLALGGVVLPGAKTPAIERNRVVFVIGVQVEVEAPRERPSLDATLNQ